MNPMVEDLVAWLPFLAAILVAFAAGFAFARVADGGELKWPRLRHGRHGRHDDRIEPRAL